MNGAAHYREAERLADQVAEAMQAIKAARETLTAEQRQVMYTELGLAVSLAKVHATLAVAAPEIPDRPVDPSTGGELQTIGRDR